MSEEESVILSYYRWYTNNLGDNPSSDIWTVEVSNNSGLSWTEIESTNLSNKSWSKQVLLLDHYVELTSDIRLRFTAEDVYYDGDFGSGGSIVEAAIDEIMIKSVGSSLDILFGDVNYDGEIDVLDIVLVVNFALNTTTPTTEELYAADINSDGVIDILDVVNIVNIILNS